MLTYFNCPDGVKRPIKDNGIFICEVCPRKEGRCMSLPKLYMVANEREWKGKTSTTMLMNPTRMEYLKITKPYTIIPKAKAYAIYGSYQHHRLDVVAKTIKELESERKLENETNTGILDLLEPDELNKGMWKLIDHKFWGAFSVVKMMDKTTYEYKHNSLQLNDYRIKVEPLGFPISRMIWDITIRDGNTKTMSMYKLTDPMPQIECNKIDDEEVIAYFFQKNEALMIALHNDTLPELCQMQERWNGRRCKGSLCEVHEFCPEGRKVNKL